MKLSWLARKTQSAVTYILHPHCSKWGSPFLSFSNGHRNRTFFDFLKLLLLHRWASVLNFTEISCITCQHIDIPHWSFWIEWNTKYVRRRQSDNSRISKVAGDIETSHKTRLPSHPHNGLKIWPGFISDVARSYCCSTVSTCTTCSKSLLPSCVQDQGREGW